MEGIEEELQNKSIERIKEVIVDKPKKPRTQAQKDAFEKARLKRAENLALKKEQAQAELTAEDEYNDQEIGMPPKPVVEPVVEPLKIIAPPPKKRGRPRKKKVEEPAPHFIPPTTGVPSNLYNTQGYNQQGYPPGYPQGYTHQPWMYQQPPKQEPVVNNYYYGSNPKEIRSEHKETIREPIIPPTPPAPVAKIEEDSSEEEYEELSDPRLKYRFA